MDLNRRLLTGSQIVLIRTFIASCIRIALGIFRSISVLARSVTRSSFSGPLAYQNKWAEFALTTRLDTPLPAFRVLAYQWSRETRE